MTEHAHNAEEMFGKHYKAGEFLPFYVPRSQMPQIDEKDLPTLIASTITSGKGVNMDVVNVSLLKAHQRIDHTKAKEMIEKVKLKPILVSADDYVLDGNHRWWAHVHEGDKFINVIRIEMNFDEAIPYLLEQPFTYEITPLTPVRN